MRGVEMDDDWVDSLDRLTEILRDQIALAQALGVTKVAVEIADLERLLNIVEGDADQSC